MESEKLISSKSYGLATDILWQICPNKIHAQFEYTAPPLVHSLFYVHERIRGDIFTALYLTEKLQIWKPEEVIIKNKTDAHIWLADVRIYLEIETGSQGRQKIEGKLREYQQYWRDTQEKFEVIFAVDGKDEVEWMLKLFDEMRVPYLVTTQKALAFMPLEAPLQSRLRQWTLAEIIQKSTPVLE